MFVKAFSALVLAGVAVAQSLTINTPDAFVQCQPVSLSFSGGTAPYILAVIPGEQTTAAAISTITDSAQSSPITWIVNIPAGTFITIKITDATGQPQYSSARTVLAGSDGCLSGSSSASGAGASSSVSSAASSAASSASSAVIASSSAAVSSLSSAAASSSARPSSSAAAMSSSSAAMSSSSSSRAASSSTPASASSAAASPSGAAAINAYAPIPMAIGAIGAALLAF